MKKKLFFFLICALIGGFLLSLSFARKEESPKTPAKAPDFKGINLVTQKEVSLKDFKDNVLLIKFWATW